MRKPLIYVVALVAVFSVLAVLVKLGLGSYANELHAAPGRLGEAMGLELLLPREKNVRADWYGGDFEGRRFAFTYGSTTVRSVATGGDTRRQGAPHIRIVVGVRRPGGQAIDLRRYVTQQRPEPVFEEAFGKVEGVEQLSANEKAALLGFTLDHGAIRLKDYAGHPRQTLPDALGFTTEWVLVHDSLGLEQTPEWTRARLQALNELALTLEGR